MLLILSPTKIGHRGAREDERDIDAGDEVDNIKIVDVNCDSGKGISHPSMVSYARCEEMLCASKEKDANLAECAKQQAEVETKSKGNTERLSDVLPIIDYLPQKVS